MVVNGRNADSSFLATPAFKIKVRKPLMEPGPGMATIIGGRRVKLASVATPSVRGTTTTTLIPTARQTAHQKVRRILDDHPEWQDRENQRSLKCSSSSPCIVSNYSIVASSGELSRNSFAVCETPAPCTVKRKATILNGKAHCREETPKSVLVGREKDTKRQSSRKENDKEPARSSKNSKRAIEKSASVPANLKEVTREKQSTKGVPEEGILKKSSAFLTSLTQSCGRNFTVLNKTGSCDNLGKSRKVVASNGLYQEFERSKGTLTSVDSGKGVALARSPSFQTLQTSWRKPSRVLVKKSVSFSKDTSFEAKRLSHRKTAIHEAKVYRKGVLQDRGDCRESSRVVSPACESPSWDPKVFLRAAREADELILKKIIDRARQFRLNGMDINAVDGSGRTAISYMAGNGAVTMLEAALSFPGLDPNLPDNEGNTPLHFAAQAGQTECLNILLQRCPGIEVDARNALGFTPLMKAALQGRTKCAKILLFAGANPTLRDHGRGLRAEQWARFCGRYVCAEVIERFARHRLLERTTSCRWGSEPELAAKVLQGKVTPIPTNLPPPSTGLRSKIRRVFRTTSGPDRSFSLVSQLTSAALCASSPALPKPEDVPPVVKSLLRPLSVPQLRVTLVAPSEIIERTTEKCGTNFTEKIALEKTENVVVKPPRTKKKNK